MNSDKVVNSEDVLKAIMNLRQLGARRVVEDLEKREPDLAEHLLEESTLIHHKLMSEGGSPKSQRYIHRRIESLMLVLILAMELAHTRFLTGLAPEDNAGPSDESR